MESRKDLVNRLMEDYCTENSVLAVIQIGSTAKGYDDEFSDVDLVMVVSDERFAVLEKSSQKFVHTDKYDLVFTTVVRLEDLVNSESDEDHWNYEKSIVLLDKTGTVRKILEKIAEYDKDSRIIRLKRYYLEFWNSTLSCFSCLKHKNDWGLRIYSALAINELIRLLFNLNNRWSPRLQWAFRELPLLEKKPADLKAQIESILETPDSDKLTKLWNDTASLLREENYTWVDHPEEIM